MKTNMQILSIIHTIFKAVEYELDDERKKVLSLASDLASAKQDAERQLRNLNDAMESMRYSL